MARLNLAKAHGACGEHESARSCTQSAMLEFRKIGDRHFEGKCYVLLGIYANGLGKHAEAVENYKVALGFFSEDEDPIAVATILNNTGNEYICLREFEQAIKICEQAIPLWYRSKDRYGLAHTWDSLGQAHYKMGNYSEATTAYKNAIELFQELRSSFFAATSLDQLGDVYADSGNHSAAYGAWRMALDSIEGTEEGGAISLIQSLNAKMQQVAPARIPHRKL